jgi:DNA modification methylase
MESLQEPFVDLCYIDPPFFSSRDYEVIWDETAEKRMFADRWKGGLQVYLDWMEPRIRQIHRLLKPEGSFYLHCDWHAGHYLKILLDSIFGYRHFQNELVWHYQTGGASRKRFSRKHDTLFWYTKSAAKWTFNSEPIMIPRTEKAMLRAQNPNGARIAADNTMKNPDDVLAIPQMNPMAKERLGYPTQKPLALLTCVVQASSNKGDMVFDPFCGCGTTLDAAQRLDRNWCGCDVSQTALRIVKARLENAGARGISVIGMAASRQELEEMNPFEFQNWAISTLYGIHAPRKSGDHGIDGFTGFLQTPVQVKQQDHVGRPTLQQFRGALNNKKKGVVLALGFTSTAHEEAARLRREEGIEIVLLTAEELLRPDFDAMGL